ncbi:DUF2514 family protein [Cupriavidus taiwanensis]|uniref:DUF2514 family protein n=1 Tax=Cupriavidus taiwanensis TaxID=164546 RepID=UPI001573402C|nr:DUF2514 family protein [Cupriavidus taiwanensis]NSX15966.1 DUF2514 family protein [Cupriavidus taiwanensis]
MIEIATARAALSAFPWRAAVALALGAGLFVAGWTVNGWRLEGRIQQLQAKQAKEREGQAGALAAASEAARAEEQRRTAEQRGIANAAAKERDQALADARAAGAVAEQLRMRGAQLAAAARAAGHSAAAGGGASAGDPLDVLTDVLGRADKRAGELAEYADRSRVAGLACERSYDALMTMGDGTGRSSGGMPSAPQ